jgi:hypothetical protein
MRASVSRLSYNTRTRVPILATSRIRYNPTATTVCPSFHQRPDLGNLGDQTPSFHPFHTTSPSSKLTRPRWLKRGMRGRIRAWAGSLGLTEGQESAPETDEPLGEELYVMPGWAVAKGRELTEDGTSASVAVDPSIGEFIECIVMSPLIPQSPSTYMSRSPATALWLVPSVVPLELNVSWSLLFVVSHINQGVVEY